MTTEAPVPGARAYLLDAGPIVAALDTDDQDYTWARRTLDRLDAPVLTCEAVLSEAWFLTGRGWRRLHARPRPPRPARRRRRPRLAGHATEAFLRQYPKRSSVADASLLALAEQDDGRVVVTTDREDFAVYRLHRRRAVPALVPPR